MTRSDYQRIAAVLVGCLAREDASDRAAGVLAVREVVARLCVAFKEQHPAFDPARFRAACGLPRCG